MINVDKDYIEFLFSKIIEGVQKSIGDNYNKCWVGGISPLDPLVAIKKIYSYTGHEQKQFVENKVLINGSYKNCNLAGIRYKRQGTTQSLVITEFEIPFITDKEKEEYAKFRESLF